MTTYYEITDDHLTATNLIEEVWYHEHDHGRMHCRWIGPLWHLMTQ